MIRNPFTIERLITPSGWWGVKYDGDFIAAFTTKKMAQAFCRWQRINLNPATTYWTYDRREVV